MLLCELVNAVFYDGFSLFLAGGGLVLGVLLELLSLLLLDAFKLLPLTELSISFLFFLGLSLPGAPRLPCAFGKGAGATGDCPAADAPQPMLNLFIMEWQCGV